MTSSADGVYSQSHHSHILYTAQHAQNTKHKMFNIKGNTKGNTKTENYGIEFSLLPFQEGGVLRMRRPTIGIYGNYRDFGEVLRRSHQPTVKKDGVILFTFAALLFCEFVWHLVCICITAPASLTFGWLHHFQQPTRHDHSSAGEQIELQGGYKVERRIKAVKISAQKKRSAPKAPKRPQKLFPKKKAKRKERNKRNKNGE